MTRFRTRTLLVFALLTAPCVAGCGGAPRNLLRTVFMAHHLDAGQAALAGGHLNRAQRELTAALRLRPHVDDTRIVLAQAYLAGHRYASALHTLQAIHDRRLKDFDYCTFLYCTSLAASYDGLNKVDAAEHAYQTAMAVDPANPFGPNDLGYFYADHNMKLDAAEVLIREALQAAPGTGAIIDSLGWLYYRKGELRQARWLLRRALSAMPHSLLSEISAAGEVHYHLGMVERDLRHRDAAADQFALALSLDPHLEKARRELKQLGRNPTAEVQRLTNWRSQLHRAWTDLLGQIGVEPSAPVKLPAPDSKTT